MSTSASGAAKTPTNANGNSTPISLRQYLSQDLNSMTRDELILCIQHAREKLFEQHQIIEQRDDELHRVLEQNRSLTKKVADGRAQLSLARADHFEGDYESREAARNAEGADITQGQYSDVPGTFVSYGPPSPFFWKDLAEHESRLHALGKHLKHIERLGVQFCEVGSQYAIVANALAMELCTDWRDVEIESADHDKLSLGANFRKLGEILKEVQVFQDILVFSIDKTFLVRIADFRTRHLAPVKAASVQLHRMWDEYEQMLLKVLHTPAASQGVVRKVLNKMIQTQEQEKLQALKKKFQMAAFDHVTDLNSLVSIRKMELLEGICSCQYAFLAFFHSGHELSLSMNPVAKEIQVIVQKKMDFFNQLQKEVIISRQKLQKSLGSADWPRSHSISPESRPVTSSSLRMNRRQSLSMISDSLNSSRHMSRVVISKAGYLLKLSSSIKKDWKRRWFVLEEGQLYYYRPVDPKSKSSADIGMGLIPEFVTNILICVVRLLPGPSEANHNQLPYCFEIISPNRRVYTLQGESDADVQSWISVILACTGFMLSTRSKPPEQHRRKLSFSSERQRIEKKDDLISLLLTANSICADCCAEGPEWSSVNHCIIICIECSGIHRSLGSHMSKVRSLTLDDINVDTLQLLLAIGNARFNAVWEAALIDPGVKPCPKSPRHVKEAFIKDKYVRRKYIILDGQIQNELLLESSNRGDLSEMMSALAGGASPVFARPLDGSTALHLAAEHNHVLAVQYILHQHEVTPHVTDHQGQTPRDRALENNAMLVAEMLAPPS
uniref:Arf-GAP with coiled-coil, ANK repeat and PH domain-containing protein n=1 Tax=Spongospora subterranea TaxID=70186 RepID=A0A0H5RM93_9EUKA|eukprot:CRZ09834.1 hypothetical protein [Spongospora subterranea]